MLFCQCHSQLAAGQAATQRSQGDASKPQPTLPKADIEVISGEAGWEKVVHPLGISAAHYVKQGQEPPLRSWCRSSWERQCSAKRKWTSALGPQCFGGIIVTRVSGAGSAKKWKCDEHLWKGNLFSQDIALLNDNDWSESRIDYCFFSSELSLSCSFSVASDNKQQLLHKQYPTGTTMRNRCCSLV